MNLWRVREAVGRVRGPAGRVVFGRPCAADRPLAGFDHGDYAELLARFVGADGLVAYADWRRDAAAVRALDDYLLRLGRADVAAPTGRADRLAFWVNAYNAAVLAGVLHDYPAGCGCRRRGWVGFDRFRDVRLWAGGTCRSLDRIEHATVRPLGEPLTHFALVCGARGCPPLRAYTAAGFGPEVAANARRFLARPDAFRADPGARTVRLTRLLKWYGRDFARTPAGVLEALRPYLPDDADLRWLGSGPVRQCYFNYDWTLNDLYYNCYIDVQGVL